MPTTKDQVRQLADAFVETLEKLTAKERTEPVTGRYANELNKLIAIAKIARPDIAAVVWPEEIYVVEDELGREKTEATYAEVETAARQIRYLL